MKAVICSDVHLHKWSAFAYQDADTDINSRLLAQLNELKRAATIGLKAGVTRMICTGDLFHVRGSVAPTVLNPTLAAFREIVQMGMSVTILAGNHDLEGDEASALGNAVGALADVIGHGNIIADPGLTIIEADGVQQGYIPWTKHLPTLEEHIADAYKRGIEELFIHAPLDGAVAGLKGAGLDPHALVAKYGRTTGRTMRIWAGHYHNHAEFGRDEDDTPGSGTVVSVGAMSHQTWGDVGAKAGFLLVNGPASKPFSYYASHCPAFVDLDPSMDEDEIRLACDGAFVRARVDADLKTQEDMRKLLKSAGALGVTLIPEARKAVARATGATVSGVATIESNVDSYVAAGGFADKAALQARCADLLSRARMVSAVTE